MADKRMLKALRQSAAQNNGCASWNSLRQERQAIARQKEKAMYNIPSVAADYDVNPMLDLDVSIATKRLMKASVEASFVDLNNADLSGLDLSHADLATHGDKSQIFLGNANLCNTILDDTHFENAQLLRADFRGATFRSVFLSRTTCKGANFSDTDLGHTIFDRTDLRKANFRGADLRYATFQKANLRGADFTHARVDLRFAQGINARHVKGWATVIDISAPNAPELEEQRKESASAPPNNRSKASGFRLWWGRH